MAPENNSNRKGINAPTPRPQPLPLAPPIHSYTYTYASDRPNTRPSRDTGGANNTSTRTAPGPLTATSSTAPPLIMVDAFTVGEEGVHMEGAHYIPVLAALSRVPRGFELVVDSRLLPFSLGSRAQEHQHHHHHHQQAQAQRYRQTPAFHAASAAPAADVGPQVHAPEPPPFSREDGQPQFLPQACREDWIQPQGMMRSIGRMGARGGLGAQGGVEVEQHSHEGDRTEAWVGAQAQTADPWSNEVFIEFEDGR